MNPPLAAVPTPSAGEGAPASIAGPAVVDAASGPPRAANDERAPVAEASLRLGGLHCAACALTIAEALERVDGVRDVSVNAVSECASVRYDPSRAGVDRLVAAIEDAGYAAVPDTAEAARALRRQESRALIWRWFVGAFCSVQIMMLATPSYVSRPGDIPPDLASLLQRGIWMLTLPVMVFSAAPFFRGAWRMLRRGRLGMDMPVSLGIAAAFVAGTAVAFDPTGPLGDTSYLDSLAMFVTFLLGGRWLEMRMRHRAEEALEETCDRLPATVTRLAADGRTEEVALAAVRAGDRLQVSAGQAFPADGVVASGRTHADEALLTGESVPVAKAAGDAVVAGSVNLDGPVVMVVERVGADTRYEAIVSLMRAARSQRPAVLAQADRWARPFLAGLLALAVVAGLVWLRIDPSRSVGVVIAVLVVTCPCALSLAAPSALMAAAGAMARRGLLARRPDAVEGLATFDVLLVDKTGTLTDARPSLAGVEVLPGAAGAPVAEDEARAVAAALAGMSRHPAAQALREVSTDGDVAPRSWQDVREWPGRGLEAVDDAGRRWRLGAPGWAAGRDDDGSSAGHGDDAGTGAGRRVVLSCDGRACLAFRLEERLRDGAVAAVAALRADGVTVRLLSGDRDEAARRVGRALGLDEAAGDCRPEDKLAALAAAQARGERVAMLGDGINDAPVLGRADVAIAMGEGAAVARAQADLVLVSNRLEDLVSARAVARHALRVVRQNLAWGAAYNAACVPLALTGHLPPWVAGLGMATSSLVVVGNSMRLARVRAGR